MSLIPIIKLVQELYGVRRVDLRARWLYRTWTQAKIVVTTAASHRVIRINSNFLLVPQAAWRRKTITNETRSRDNCSLPRLINNQYRQNWYSSSVLSYPDVVREITYTIGEVIKIARASLSSGSERSCDAPN